MASQPLSLLPVEGDLQKNENDTETAAPTVAAPDDAPTAFAISLQARQGDSTANEATPTTADDAVDREPSPGPATVDFRASEAASQATDSQPGLAPAPSRANVAGQKRKRSGTEPKQKSTRFAWNTEQTAAIMEWFLVARQEGLLPVKKKANLAVAWRRVLELAKVTLGEAAYINLTESKISDKFNNEKKRFLAWQAWTDKSGVSYDAETGAVHGVDITSAEWEEFAARVKGTAVTWISLGQTLGKVSTYRALWSIDRAKGVHIQLPADEAVVPPAAGLDPFSAGIPPPALPPRSARSGAEGGGEGASEDDGEAYTGGKEESEEMTARRERTEVRRQKETDPDLNPTVLGETDDDFELVSVGRGRRKARSRRFPPSPSPSPSPSTPSATLPSGASGAATGLPAAAAASLAIANGLSSIASAMFANNRDRELTAAAADLCQRYKTTRGPRDVLRACNRLKDEGNVALWNAMDDEMKDEFMDELSQI